MKLPVRLYLTSLSLLAASTFPVLAQPAYQLPGMHSFAVGDVEVGKRTFSIRKSAFRMPDKLLQGEWSQTLTEHRRTEVLQVDAKGQPVLLRVHILLSRQETKVTAPVADRGASVQELKDIYFLARCYGILFTLDPDTVKVPKGTTLTDAQLGLVREYLSNTHVMLTRPQTVMLLPTEAITVGQSWVPSEESLKEYVRLEPTLAAIDAVLTDTSFRLVSVRDGVADIAYRMRMTGKERGATLVSDDSVTRRIDLTTGLWGEWSCKAKVSSKAEDQESLSWIETDGTPELIPGTGKASQEPEGLERLDLSKATSPGRKRSRWL